MQVESSFVSMCWIGLICIFAACFWISINWQLHLKIQARKEDIRAEQELRKK